MKNNTAIGAKLNKFNSANGITNNIIFRGQEHKEFFLEYLPKCRHTDVYHKALVYCLGIDEDTRECVEEIYDFKTGRVKTGCLHEGWITGGSARIIRLAFNLYCNGAPSVIDYEDPEERVNECRKYTVEDLFCCGYAKYFQQAVKIRYPEYF